jgi:alpha-glucosidase (family GH31 glycosyl hydrolase)
MNRIILNAAVFAIALMGSAYASDNNPITIGHARFTVIAPEAIRMEYSPSGTFIDDPSLFAITRNPVLTDDEQKNLKIDVSGKNLTIDTGKMVFTYSDDGVPFHNGNPSAVVKGLASGATSNWTFGQAPQNNLGGTNNSLDHVAGPVALADGLLSKDGFYYLDDSQRFLIPGGDAGWVKQRDANTDSIDGYFFAYGLDYKAGLKALTRVSGQVPMPRRYTMGTWYSMWWKYTSTDYRNIMQEFHDHNFPLDMLVMDMDWHITPGWTGYSWNRALLPDAEQLVKDIHTAGLHLTLNDHPAEGVKPNEDMYADFMKAMGQDPTQQKTLPYDSGNENYMKTLMAYTHTPLEKEGVDFWWVDWMGDDQSPFNKMGWINELYFRHSQTSIPEYNLRGQSFSRWADWGDQRHPIHFSGDTKIVWPMLQFEIPFTSTAGNVGCFFWSHDTGGFIDDTDPLNAVLQRKQGELIARWTQFTSVSAVTRLHSANRAWLDKRPWKYSLEIENSMRVSFHLRSEIFPYIYSQAWRSHQDSIPLIRPLYIDYPETPEAYNNSQEYLFGDGMLAAPIVTPGHGFMHTSSQKVWFPEGRWFDWFDGKEYSGTQTISNDINAFPLFVRGGFPLVTETYNERMASGNRSNLVIKLYPGTDGQTSNTTLYEDDGQTTGYLNGNYALTHIAFKEAQNQMQLTMTPEINKQLNHDYLPATRTYEIQYMSSSALKSVSINGAVTKVTFDSAQKTNHIMVPETPTDQNITITMGM